MCTGEYAKHPGAETFRVLFVGEHNACRSQMAEAIAQSLGAAEVRLLERRPRPARDRPADARLPEGEGLRRSAAWRRRHSTRSRTSTTTTSSSGSPRRRSRPSRAVPRKIVYVDWSIDDPSQVAGLARGEVRAAYEAAFTHPLPQRPRPRRRRPGRHASTERGPADRRRPHDPTPFLDAARLSAPSPSPRPSPLPACESRRAPAPAAKTVIQNKGSDTMVNVAQVWAEEYRKAAPDVEVEVSGGGSGVGHRRADQGQRSTSRTPAATSSRARPSRRRRTPARRRSDFIVGYDALAVYVHKDNPLAEITLEQLTEHLRGGRQATRWSELGVTIPGSTTTRSCA